MSKPEPRPRCPRCHRALRTCVCTLARPVAHQVEVLILMHPMEVHEAKGTGHLLHLCLPRSRVMVGEEFDAAELEAALHGRWASRANTANTADTADTDSAPRHNLLLYPDTASQDATLGLAAASPLPLPWPQPPERLRLVIIDGTWRKSRKMLYLNPALQALPRLPLLGVEDSGYAIRKAHLPGQLSSFEAATLALAQLQKRPEDAAAHAALQEVFSQFVAQQLQLRQCNQAPQRSA
ncbi:DTW domain-containing protein [Comamonas sp. Tr-654]|uniref:tRNA-uridine aminocarboxypropyltransferase n=1 Tax=Comamonas sp. Tr-654 TaxID=2608341 RepID=UPI00141EED8A|nr:tRNA-uridine aminocarboxypropyltransferase [Comamonas sp. Tr-654]NIF83632.1 DTW domain-containing protein [Comamonas sp. Tr-654]